jgi:type I restriction enzyme S subunit
MAFAGDNLYTNEAIISIPDTSIYNLRFIYYYLLSYDWKSLTDGNEKVKGATLNKTSIGNIKLPTLSLSEQKEIVNYLDSSFAKIDKLKENAAKNLEEAKALFQSALKDALEPKEGWEEKDINSLCSKITDGTHHSPINAPLGDYKYITAKNIKSSGLDLNNITYVSKEVHKEIFSRCNPEKGDILYIKDGATTGIAIENPLEEEFSMLSSVALLKPIRNIVNSSFLCYLLNSPDVYEQARSRMDGAAITRVTLKKIKVFRVSIPPLSEQQSIVSFLDSLNEKVNTLQQNYSRICDECDALKQAILRQVFE